MKKGLLFKDLLISSLLLVMLGFSIMPCYSQKEKKEKKSKKPFVWEMPSKLTGLEEFDKYLFECDTLYTNIQNYKESMTFYKVDTVYVLDKETNTPYMAVKILDQNNNEKSWSSCIVQVFEGALAGTNIALDATNITLQTALATTALAEAPLYAFSHGKYLKAGPVIVGMAGKEVAEIVSEYKRQYKTMKEIHKNKTEKSTDTTVLIAVSEDENLDLDSLTDINDIDLGTNDGAVDLPDNDNI